ncbi:unnamed protein product [Menidia menidia]|uniref:Serine/arginine repetitive matrix protein 1 n=2 Tax=Percomorphaceae TaxID=1489872 RepID=A0A8S4AKS6_9TELE|nr:unnamed protein product [Menidia menidia]
MDAGFFRGTSAEQDNRFSNKQKKLLKQLKFAECLDKKVDMTKVNLEVIKPWITQRVTEILGFEDDVVIEFIFNQLEEKHPDSKMMQINLTGFLNGKNAREFMRDLWPLLLSAQENIAGIPSAFLEQKKEEIRQRQIEQEKLASLRKVDEDKKETRERAQSKSPRRRKTRSPGSGNAAPRRPRDANPAPRAGAPRPPPLMQLPTKPPEQIPEPEPNPETLVQEPAAIGETAEEAVKEESVVEVKEASPEKVHKKEERPRSREREKDARKDRAHHRSRSHSRSRRRRSRSRSYSPRRRQSPRRRMSPRRRSPPRRGPVASRHRTRRSPVRRRRSRSASSSGSSSSGSRSPKKAVKRISTSPPRKPAQRPDAAISPAAKIKRSPSPRSRRGRGSVSPPRSSGLKRKPGGRSDSPSDNAKARTSEGSESEEDKNEKGATADSVQQRRQYRRQNQQSSSDSGSSSSEDEGPKGSAAGPAARNGDVRRRRSRTPSPRRRHRENSPRRRRSPSPGHRRRSPSPPRRRRSPSPPRRRETAEEAVKEESVVEVKEASPEKVHKKEERPRSREREKDARKDRAHHRSRSHSRSRRRRSRSRSYSPRRRQSPRRRMSPRRRSPPRRGPVASRHRTRRSPVRRRRSRSASSSGSSSSGSRSPKKAVKRISTSPPRKPAQRPDAAISPAAKIKRSPSPRSRRGRGSVSPPRSSAVLTGSLMGTHTSAGLWLGALISAAVLRVFVRKAEPPAPRGIRASGSDPVLTRERLCGQLILTRSANTPGSSPNTHRSTDPKPETQKHQPWSRTLLCLQESGQSHARRGGSQQSSGNYSSCCRLNTARGFTHLLREGLRTEQGMLGNTLSEPEAHQEGVLQVQVCFPPPGGPKAPGLRLPPPAKKASSGSASQSPNKNSDVDGGGKKKKKKKEKKHKKDKKHKKHKKHKKEKSGGAVTADSQENQLPEEDGDSRKESESEADEGLDDLEKHLREKALRSMRKAQLSPSQMS